MASVGFASSMSSETARERVLHLRWLWGNWGNVYL
jgi:hypothetical protein